MAFQADWRWCNRCQVLFYAGFGNGVCFDEEPHDPTGSGPYVVPIDEQPGGTQEGWCWCNRCQGLCFTGHGAGVCHDGEPHDIEGSSTYFVALGEPPAGNQDGWRWCSRCQVLMYAGFGDGLCWDGQRHYPDDSGTYSVEFEVSQRPPPPPPPPPPLPRPPRISVAEDGGQIGVSGDGFAANGRVRLSFVRGADVKKVELTATPGGLFSWFTRSFDQERVGGAVIAVDLASGQFGVGRTQRAFPAFRPIELPPPDLIPG